MFLFKFVRPKRQAHQFHVMHVGNFFALSRSRCFCASSVRAWYIFMDAIVHNRRKPVTCRHLDSVRSPAPTEIERLLVSTDISATANQIQIFGFLLQVSKTLQAYFIQSAIQEHAILRQRRVTCARGSSGSVFGREGGREESSD